jgi:multiple sugar transport system substrate-binding protein
MKGIAFFVKSHIDYLLLAIGLLVLLAGLFWSGGKKAIAAVTAPTLVFTQWWQDEIEEGALETLVSEFETLHPEIKIELKKLPYEELKALLFTAPAGEALPPFPGDILALDPLWGAGLEGREILEPPPPPPSAEAAPSRGFPPGNPETPVLDFFCPLFYNIDMLTAAGFSSPPKTRNEFLSYARKVSKREEGVYGIAMALAPGNSRGIYRDIYSWIWASGALLFNAGKPAITSREITETLEFLAALGRENLIHPDSFEMGEAEKQEAFIRGRAAFIIAPVQDAEIFSSRMSPGAEGRIPPGGAFGFTAIPVPGGHSGKPAFGAFGWTLGISRQSRYKEEAGVFISFLAEKASYLAEKLHAVPGNRTNPPAVQAQNGSLYSTAWDSKAWDLYIACDFIREFAGLKETARLEAAFTEELAFLLSGERGAAASAAAVQKQWEKILEEAE